MSLFVLCKDGVPFESPEVDAEMVNALMAYDNGVASTFAFTSTVKQHVEVMRQVLPGLLGADADFGPEAFDIVEYVPRAAS